MRLVVWTPGPDWGGVVISDQSPSSSSWCCCSAAAVWCCRLVGAALLLVMLGHNHHLLPLQGAHPLHPRECSSSSRRGLHTGLLAAAAARRRQRCPRPPRAAGWTTSRWRPQPNARQPSWQWAPTNEQHWARGPKPLQQQQQQQQQARGQMAQQQQQVVLMVGLRRVVRGVVATTATRCCTSSMRATPMPSSGPSRWTSCWGCSTTSSEGHGGREEGDREEAVVRWTDMQWSLPVALIGVLVPISVWIWAQQQCHHDAVMAAASAVQGHMRSCW